MTGEAESLFPLKPHSWTRLHILAAASARASQSSCPPEDQEGAGKAGRRLAPEVPRVRKERARGGRQVVPVARPSLRDGFHGVLRAPRGALHYCPRRLADDRCARRLAATSPQDLTPEPRASGPHDFSVRARPRWVLHGWRALTVETMRRRCQRRVVSHLSLLTVSRPASDHCAPTPSRPPHPIPRSVTIAIRPLVEWNRTGT
jgi:hypothetical protein